MAEFRRWVLIGDTGCRLPTHCEGCQFDYGPGMGMIKAVATIVGAAAPLTAAAIWVAPAQAKPVGSDRAACALARARVAIDLHRDPSSIPDCETVRLDDAPRGFYVLALRGHCREPICGSTLIGWYAAQKSTGRLFEWDMGEDRLGRELRPVVKSARHP